MNDTTQSIDLAIYSDPNAELAIETIERLRQAGYIAYLAGGCVRDALLKRTPKDYDVATDARPEQIRELFGHRRTLSIGAAFGVVSVLGKKHAAQDPVEVATFRSDGPYSDGRRPDTVHYSTPEEDAARRDFTINGLFYDPIDHHVIDFVGGRRDLEAGQIRAIGDPHARFREDRLRLLRAVRIATVYGFQLEATTLEAIVAHAMEVIVCSGERIGAEMRRLLLSEHAARGMQLLRDCRLAAAIMPTVDAAIADDATLQQLQERLTAFDDADIGARLAAVVLACGSSAADALSEIAAMWRLSAAETEAAASALQHHKFFLRADRLPWSVIQPLLVHRDASSVASLARAVARATGTSAAAIGTIDERMAWPREQLDPPPLLTGNDLKRMGMQPGPEFRVALDKVRAAQLDGQISSPEQAEKLIQDLGTGHTT